MTEKLRDFTLYLMREERSENTIACYNRDIKSFATWLNKPFDETDEFDLIAYKKYLLEREKTAITANRKLASVNAFFKFLFDTKETEILLNIRLIKTRDKAKFKGLLSDTVDLFRKAVYEGGNEMHICIAELFLCDGVRVSELAGLTLDNIVISENDNHIRILGKGMVDRTLPLSARAKDAILSYLEVRKDSPSNRLLIGKRGALGRGAIEIIIGKYAKMVGTHFTPHTLRHTLGYKLITSGTPITTIQTILGHESILTTLLYTQTTEKDKADALESAWN